MKAIDTIILLGPSSALYPLVSDKIPKFELPFVNTTLLNHAINYVHPYSSQIFIFCLEQHRNNVHAIIKDYTFPIEVITTVAYEGMGHCLGLLRNRVRLDTMVICRGDMYYVDSLGPMLENFFASSDFIHASIYQESHTAKNNNHGSAQRMFIDGSDHLIYFSDDEIPFLRGEKIFASDEYALKNFFICRSDILKLISENSHSDLKTNFYSFKKNVIPFLLLSNKKIRIIKNDNFVVSNLHDYSKQLHFKNNFVESKKYSLCFDNSSVEDSTDLIDSIVGCYCVIRKGCSIKKCVIMDNTTIMDGCILENCIIGFGVTIIEGSKLVNCRVGHFSTFDRPVFAENINLNK